MQKSRTLALLTGAMGLSTLALVAYHDKWLAVWWGFVPVLLVAVAGSFMCFKLVERFGYTIESYRRQPVRALLILAAGCAFCLVAWGGLYYTEDTGWNATERSVLPQEYNWQHSRAGYYLADSIESFSYSGAELDLGDDSEGAGYLLLIILFALLILASFVVPHFWVVGCFCVTAIALRLTIYQYRLEKRLKERHNEHNQRFSYRF